MKESITSQWIDNLVFETNIEGHKIIVDAKSEVGGTDKGTPPKLLMMVALSGCTGIDVASLLKKMRIEFDEFTIKIEGDITEEHPKHFSGMHIIYEIRGKDMPADKIKRAIELSQDKYCGVSASYKKAMKLTYELKII
jgi:putative redox protein